MTELLEKINNKQAKIGIIGLGYVGLPLMHSVCRGGYHVTGFDIDAKKITLLNEGKSYLDTVPEKIIQEHVYSKSFYATNDFSALKEIDIICVPTPLDKHREPDLSYVINTVDEIAKHLRKDQMVVLESTTYPGTMDEEVQPILEKTGLKAGKDFFLAFSPEREDPGNPNFETSTIPKVVGANSELERHLAESFYQNCVNKVVVVTSSATAEAVKITENIFRAVNIALVNELKIIYAAMGIDMWEVVDAAKTKPFGYMPFYPGPGLGGHCIPIDPFYLTWKARELEMPTRFIELAGEINTAMPSYIVQKTVEALSEKKQKSINGAKILVLGVAYKKNINDQRESPAFPIMQKLEKLGARVSYHDPHIPIVGDMRHFPEFSGRESIQLTPENLTGFDGVLLITDHDSMDYGLISKNSDLIIDTRNAFHSRDIKGQNILKA